MDEKTDELLLNQWRHNQFCTSTGGICLTLTLCHGATSGGLSFLLQGIFWLVTKCTNGFVGWEFRLCRVKLSSLFLTPDFPDMHLCTPGFETELLGTLEMKVG